MGRVLLQPLGFREARETGQRAAGQPGADANPAEGPAVAPVGPGPGHLPTARKGLEVLLRVAAPAVLQAAHTQATLQTYIQMAPESPAWVESSL